MNGNPFAPIRRQLESIEQELNEIDDHRVLTSRTTEDLTQQVDELWGMMRGIVEQVSELAQEMERVSGRRAMWG